MNDLLLRCLFGGDLPGDHGVAFDAEGHTVTLSQLHRDAAGWLRQVEAHQGRRWALCFDDTYRFLAAYLGVLLSRREIVLFDHSRPGAFSDLAEQFDGLLTDRPDEGPVNPVPVLTEGPPAELPAELPADLEQGVMRLFTSGSTGQPKPIVKFFWQATREVEALLSRWQSRMAGCGFVSTVAHQHYYGLVYRVFLPLACHGALDRHMLHYPQQLLAAASQRRVLVSSPALLKRLDGEAVREGYRMIWSAGGRLPLEAADDAERRLGCRPTEIFGASEIGSIAWRFPTEEATLWQPLPGVRVNADDDGRLHVRSSYVPGEDWFASDDRVTLFEDGHFRLEGRMDRIVKVEEKRVSLDEIERCLQALPEVQEAAAVVLAKGDRVSMGAVVVLSAAGREALAAQGPGAFRLALRQVLHERLQPVAIPRQFRFVEHIPLNPQGKRVMVQLQGLFA